MNFIPAELSKMYSNITLESSQYHKTFKTWWNRSVDSIRQDNFATETKRIISGLADIRILSNDLQHRVEVEIQNVRHKQEEFIKCLTEIDSNEKPFVELLYIWDGPFFLTKDTIVKSLNLLNESKPVQLKTPFTEAETLYHRIKGTEKVLDNAAMLYAKYLGMEKCIAFYWEWDQLCYFDEARANTSLVSWDGIQNTNIKELLAKGHRPDHSARIRYRYYMEEEDYSMTEAYTKVSEELEQLRPEVTYALPDSVRSFNKTAKNYINELRDVN